jgi:hypothetical protein
MTPLECFDWLVAVYVDRGFPAKPESPAGLRVAKVRSALTPAKPLSDDCKCPGRPNSYPPTGYWQCPKCRAQWSWEGE